MAARWWCDGLRAIGLQWLQDTSYNQIDHGVCSTFAERWHEETLSFHLLFGKMTVTLDDVSCLLHLPIEGMLLTHESMTWDEAMEMMIQHLGVDPGDTFKEATDTNGGHARFSYLRMIFKKLFLKQLGVSDEGDMVLTRKLQEHALRIYLLYLVGITIFTDEIIIYVDVTYLKYFRDLELVADYSWRVAALSHLYKELNNASHYNTKHLSGYLSWLQV